MRRNWTGIAKGLSWVLCALWLGSPGAAQEAPAPPTPVNASAAASRPATVITNADDDEREVDFTVINSPTTMRLPKHRLAFRITHRFLRGLKAGSFSDLASDFFGLDGHAQIGIELRFGVTNTTQFGVQRMSDRTIMPFAQQELVRQGRAPVGVAALASIEGLNNFQRDYSPRLGLVFSRSLKGGASFYAVPMWVGHTLLAQVASGSTSTFALGLGTRLHVVGPLAVLGEYTPRLAGYKDPGARNHFTAGAEMRVGGHCFQLNVSNDPGTTPAAVARGQEVARDWYIGFNLSRKFF
jgi:hypothetical protein